MNSKGQQWLKVGSVYKEKVQRGPEGIPKMGTTKVTSSKVFYKAKSQCGYNVEQTVTGRQVRQNIPGSQIGLGLQRRLQKTRYLANGVETDASLSASDFKKKDKTNTPMS